MPNLVRQQLLPYRPDYELNQNPTHLLPIPPPWSPSLTKSFSRWCLSSASLSISWACWSLASTSCCCRSLCLKTLSMCCRKPWRGPPVRSSLSQGGLVAAAMYHLQRPGCPALVSHPNVMCWTLMGTLGHGPKSLEDLLPNFTLFLSHSESVGESTGVYDGNQLTGGQVINTLKLLVPRSHSIELETLPFVA